MRHQSSVPEIINVNFLEILQKMNLYTPELQKLITVSDHDIIANQDVFIKVDKSDYREDLIIESTDYYLLPGILTITSTLDNTINITLPFDFSLQLNKGADFFENGNILTFNYVEGESIAHQESYLKYKDVSIMEHLFEGQAKYITNPELLVKALLEHMEVDLCILEIIVQNMYRSTSDLSTPARLTNYESFEILGQKKQPLETSWENALAFENVKKAIHRGLVTHQNSIEDPITRIINEKYQDDEK